LEAEGLIKKYPKLGVVVAELALRDVVEAFQIREFIEVPAAAIAAKVLTRAQLQEILAVFDRVGREGNREEAVVIHNEADAKLHALIVQATGNSRLMAINGNLGDVCQRARAVGTPIRFEESVAEHKQLLHHLQNGDSEAAAQAMRSHLIAARQRLVEVI
jgi:DNA-binding GntR family transcriptional regulator